jgi:hypothetical protein
VPSIAADLRLALDRVAFSSPLEPPSMRGIVPLVLLSPGAGPRHDCVYPTDGANRSDTAR